jgi:hypothetical protein
MTPLGDSRCNKINGINTKIKNNLIHSLIFLLQVVIFRCHKPVALPSHSLFPLHIKVFYLVGLKINLYI